MSTTHHESLGFTKLVAGGTAPVQAAEQATFPTIICGSGAPTVAAPRGSLYLRSDGTFYVNTNGSTGWAQTGTFALPQALDVTDSPTFVGLTLSGAISTPTNITASGTVTALNVVATGDVKGATMHLGAQLVSKGAADSGGTGFALLRVPN